MILILALLNIGLARPTAAEMAQTWSDQFASLSKHSSQMVLLDDADFEQVANGKIAKRRLNQAGPDRAIGMGWTPHSRNAVWIAIIDEIHNTMVRSLTEKRLGLTESGAKLLYQRLDLPWPFQNRQWTIAIENNAALAQATQGRFWERYWTLTEPTEDGPTDPNALWVPTLDGAWMAASIDGGTLLIYQARTTIGGAIPDDLVTRWAMSTLDEMLENVFQRAADIPRHYTADHEVIIGGDLKEIKPFQ